MKAYWLWNAGLSQSAGGNGFRPYILRVQSQHVQHIVGAPFRPIEPVTVKRENLYQCNREPSTPLFRLKSDRLAYPKAGIGRACGYAKTHELPQM